MRRVVRKIIIDFDYTLLPEYDKVYPLNDDEALVVENLIKSNLVEHKMEISDAISQAMIDSKTNNVYQIIIKYFKQLKHEPEITIIYHLYKGEKGYRKAWLKKQIIRIIKLSISIAVGIYLSHIINGIP